MNLSVLLNTGKFVTKRYKPSTPKNMLNCNSRLLSQKRPTNIYYFNALLPNGINLAESNKEFYALYPTILNNFKESYAGDFDEIFDRFDYAIRYNILNRNYRLCFPVINVYALLIPDGHDTKDKRLLAYILDWCLEFIATGCILQDDIVDQSDNRWGRPCWYQIDSIGKYATCDVKMMEMASYMLIKKHFSKFPYYKQILDLFTKTYFVTGFGQSLDIQMSTDYQKSRNLRILSLHTFYCQYYYKTYFFICRISVYLGMYITDRNYFKYHDIIDNLLERMANLQQTQNDVWDCFGSTQKYGKIGKDIQLGKATWLIATAKKLANIRQLQLLKENYGKLDSNAYKIVREIYDDLDLFGQYRKYKTEEIMKLHRDIELTLPDPLKQVMYQCIETYDVRDNIVLEGNDHKAKTHMHTFT